MTRHQEIVLETIRTLWRRELCAPTARELARVLGVSAGAAVQSMARLRKQGVLVGGRQSGGKMRPVGMRVVFKSDGMMLFWKVRDGC